MKCKKLLLKDGKKNSIDRFPNFHYTGSIIGMKNLYYDKGALLVRCGSWIYNVTSEPQIYHNVAL